MVWHDDETGLDVSETEKCWIASAPGSSTAIIKEGITQAWLRDSRAGRAVANYLARSDKT